MDAKEYEIRRRVGIPKNWRTHSDAQIMAYANLLDPWTTVDSIEDLIDEMWLELDNRDHQREANAGGMNGFAPDF